jgi:hypothetical protein
MQTKRIVVTGIGTLNPLGNNLETYWDNLIKGVSGADMITLFDASKFKTRFACEIKGFDPTEFMDRKEARKLDRFAQIALVASDQAVADAGITKENVDHDRVGVIFASGIGGLTTFTEEVTNYVNGDGTPRFNPFFIPKMILDIAAGQISMKHGFRGPNYAVVSACASSTNAIVSAMDNLKLGKADIIITGGSEAVIGAAGMGGFNAMKAMSERNDDPKTASRPYDKDRDGFIMGEAAGVFLFSSHIFIDLFGEFTCANNQQPCCQGIKGAGMAHFTDPDECSDFFHYIEGSPFHGFVHQQYPSFCKAALPIFHILFVHLYKVKSLILNYGPDPTRRPPGEICPAGRQCKSIRIAIHQQRHLVACWTAHTRYWLR